MGKRKKLVSSVIISVYIIFPFLLGATDAETQIKGKGAGVSWVAPDGLRQNKRLIIQSNGVKDFGSKHQAPEKLRIYEDEVFENGSKVTAFDALESGEALPSGVITRRFENVFVKDNVITRREKKTRLLLHGRNWSDKPKPGSIWVIGNPLVIDGLKNDRLLLRYWVKARIDWTHAHRLKYESAVGEFVLPDHDSGEVFGELLRSSNGFEARLTGFGEDIDRGFKSVHFESTRENAVKINNDNMSDTTLTGVTSGATINLGDKPNIVDSEKMFRLREQQQNSLGVILAENLHQFFMDGRSGRNGGTRYPRPRVDKLATRKERRQWIFYQVELDYSKSKSIRPSAKIWINGTLTKADNKNFDDVSVRSVDGRGPTVSWLGMSGGPIQDLIYDEVYIDTSFARVILSAHSKFKEGSRSNEIQPIDSWSNDQVEVRIDHGAFTPGSEVYLYVIRDDGTPVAEEGVPLMIPGESGCPRCPASPNVLEMR